MKKILLTGFEAFNGRSVNPSAMIVEKITAPEKVQLIKTILPVEYCRTTELLTELVEKEHPDVILSLGQAGNMPHLSVERVAVNLNNGRSSDGESVLPDSSGDAAVDRPIVKDGENAYFSTLPVWELIEAVRKQGVPCRASYSAGTYVCNHVMYVGAHLASQYEGMISGFIHVPFLPEQLNGKLQEDGRYAMSLEDMVTGVQAAVDYLGKALCE